jgi:hypothetical protein
MHVSHLPRTNLSPSSFVRTLVPAIPSPPSANAENGRLARRAGGARNEEAGA